MLTLDNHKIEHLFHEIEDFDAFLIKQIESFKARHDYGKLTDSICFTNSLQAECERVNVTQEILNQNIYNDISLSYS